MKTFPKIAAAVAVAGAAVVAAVLPGSGAVASESPSAPVIRVESPATLEARGAAVRVSVTVVCPAGRPASVSLEITQRSGGAIASGYDSLYINSCTGTAQTFELLPTAYNEPFRRGVAFASAGLGGVGPNTISDNREIEVVR